MNLEQFYKKVIEIGIHNDLRGKTVINKILKEEKEKYNNLKADDKEFYDKDRLFNPFADTRILNGERTLAVKKIIAGIDMGIGELLLTVFLNQKSKQKIDLVISHHPEGYALAQLYDVMRLQADLLAEYGINISTAEHLMEKRIGEIERRLLPVNHNRTADAAKVLNIPMMCIHTPGDNCVTKYLSQLFTKEKPYMIKDLIKILLSIPEYKKSAKLQAPPKIFNGNENHKCGKIFVEMTGGTSGSKEIFEKMGESGISTVVGMHMSEEYLENARKANLNVVIAGHISSDTLGLNLLFDQIEKEEKFDFLGISGFERIRR